MQYLPRTSNSVERLILEGIAYIATQPPYSEADCRVLRAFHSEDWLLNFHESLAYLQEMGRVELIAGKYALTQAGKDRLCSIAAPPELNVQSETQQIYTISEDVSKRLGLQYS